MAAQTKYNYVTGKNIAGGIYDMYHYHVDSRFSEVDNGKLIPGMGVVQGDVVGSSVKLPEAGSTADNFEGVVVNGFTNQHDLEGKVSVMKNANIGVMQEGRIWVALAHGATPVYGAPVYLIVSGEEAGLFTSGEADNGSTISINARFLTGASDGIAAVALHGTPATSLSSPVTVNDKVGVAVQSLAMGGKKASDLISADTTIYWNGNVGVVTGTINKMDNSFGGSAGKGGHFFPFTLADKYAGKTMKVGNLIDEKQEFATATVDVSDKTNVQRLENLKTPYATYEITDDDGLSFALDFSKAVLGK